jgi:hypothetical protein
VQVSYRGTSEVEAEFAPGSSTTVYTVKWVQSHLHYTLFSLTISYNNREINNNEFIACVNSDKKKYNFIINILINLPDIKAQFITQSD